MLNGYKVRLYKLMIRHTVMDMEMVTLQNSARYIAAALAVAVLLSQRMSVLVRLVCLGDICRMGQMG